ncbi:MAG: cytochrome c oxidase subunit I, partial [Microcystaceae cyanobacterium]
ALYDVQFQPLNVLSTVGAYVMAVSTVPFVINVAWSLLKGEQAGRNPWRALTLEWQTSSPPIIENFEEEPVLWCGPYDFGIDSESVDGEESASELLAEVVAEAS